MSQENVDVVRRLYEAYSGGDLKATIRAVCDPDIEWQASEGFGLLRGRDTVIRHFEGFLDAFEHWQVMAEELIDAGDEIVGVTHARGSGKASRVGVDAHYAIVFTVRSKVIIRAREYATRADALEAVGLAEQAMSQENVEIVRRFFEALNRSHTEGIFPADLFDPAVEFDFSRRLVDPGVYRGLDEVRRWVEEERAIYRAIEIVPEEVTAVGEKLVASVVARGVGTLSGAAVEALVANVLTFRAGRLLRLEYFGDREQALEAVGLGG